MATLLLPISQASELHPRHVPRAAYEPVEPEFLYVNIQDQGFGACAPVPPHDGLTNTRLLTQGSIQLTLLISP